MMVFPMGWVMDPCPWYGFLTISTPLKNGVLLDSSSSQRERQKETCHLKTMEQTFFKGNYKIKLFKIIPHWENPFIVPLASP